MIKKNLKVIISFILILCALALPIVNAAEENQEATPISTETTNENGEANDTTTGTEEAEQTDVENTENTTTTEENFKQGDVYLTGADVTIDYIVDGNLFIVANNVTISSQIGGDAFIFANSVTVTETGYVFSNLFTTAANVDIKGVAYDLYAMSDTINITGYIYRDIKVSCNTLNMNGTIGRNAFVDCSNINFAQQSADVSEDNSTTIASQGIISGDLNYTAKEEISIPDGAVEGTVNFNEEEILSSNNIQAYLLSLGSFLVLTIVIWLLILWLAPKFNEKASNLATKKILPVIGLGILTPILLLVVSIILLLINITASVAALMFILWLALLIVSKSIFVIVANNLICNKLKIEKTIGIFGILIVSSIVVWALGLIPYVGTLISIIAVVLGLGILVSSIILKDNKEKNTTKKQEK